MLKTQIFHSRSRRLAAAVLLSSAALLSAAACSGQQSTPAAHGTTRGSTSAAATASGSVAASIPASAVVSAGASTAAASSGASKSNDDNSGGGTTVAAAGSASCGNSSLQVKWGYGSQSQPQQYSAVEFVNVSSHTCTLDGYPGLSIEVNGTVIDATRTLNGAEPPLKSPQLVTLAPGAKAYAIAQWTLATTGHSCAYPTGTGTFEATAPNTTHTVVLSSGAQVGISGICSGLAISPVEVGNYGLSTRPVTARKRSRGR